MRQDYYGNGIKWFVGVVKDISDPLNSNRVRVRIKGIHPEDPNGDGGESGAGGSGTAPFKPNGETGETPGGGGGGGGGGSNDAPSPKTEPMAAVPVDEANLPNHRELDKKISKYFTLGDLTTKPVCSARVRYHLHELTPEIIKNLSNLASNALDPIKEKYPGVIITSGWRPAGSGGSSSKNHGPGYAADLQLPGYANKGSNELWEFVKNNLKGRYTFNYNEHNHLHIQLGGSSNQGSLANPLNRIK